MATIRIRRGAAADWTSLNPVLALGEPGLETDTRKVKYGDGSTAWASLGYSVASVTVNWGDIGGTLASQTDLATALGAKAPLASPAFTGTPTAPTASGGTSNTQIATTAFVATAVTALINSAPGALDTLKELADAIGDDPNYAATITAALAGKLAKSSNLSDLTNVGTARANLRSSCRVTMSANLTAIDLSAGYVVPWNTETWDDASWHDNSTNTERMTVPAGVDRVEFIVGLRLTGLTASVQTLAQILKNGSTIVGAVNFFTSGTSQLISLNGADSCTTGDYYTVKVTQAGGTTSGTVATAGSVQFLVKAV